MANFDISNDSIRQFEQAGYLLLENALPSSLLQQWRNIADQLEQQAMVEYEQGHQGSDYCVVQDPVGPRLMRYDNMLELQTEASLDLLACPAFIALSEKLCGLGAIPIAMDILYKQQHPHPVINWHQGAQHPRTYPYLNIGIYLDDAPEGDGCLRYVPGTQHKLEDIQELSQQHGWEIPGTIEQPAKAGDILIQDMMILHGSQPKRSSGCRRTIYIELRCEQGIIESQSQSEEWADIRKQFMALVLERTQHMPDGWQHFYPIGKVNQSNLITQMRAKKEPPIPAVWATFPIEHPEYPVPSELRAND